MKPYYADEAVTLHGAPPQGSQMRSDRPSLVEFRSRLARVAEQRVVTRRDG